MHKLLFLLISLYASHLFADLSPFVTTDPGTGETTINTVYECQTRYGNSAAGLDDNGSVEVFLSLYPCVSATNADFLYNVDNPFQITYELYRTKFFDAYTASGVYEIVSYYPLITYTRVSNNSAYAGCTFNTFNGSRTCKLIEQPLRVTRKNVSTQATSDVTLTLYFTSPTWGTTGSASVIKTNVNINDLLVTSDLNISLEIGGLNGQCPDGYEFDMINDKCVVSYTGTEGYPPFPDGTCYNGLFVKNELCSSEPSPDLCGYNGEIYESLNNTCVVDQSFCTYPAAWTQANVDSNTCPTSETPDPDPDPTPDPGPANGDLTQTNEALSSIDTTLGTTNSTLSSIDTTLGTTNSTLSSIDTSVNNASTAITSAVTDGAAQTVAAIVDTNNALTGIHQSINALSSVDTGSDIFSAPEFGVAVSDFMGAMSSAPLFAAFTPPDLSGSTCPTYTIDLLVMFGKSFTLDSHCQFFAQYGSLLRTLMIAFSSFFGFLIVIRK